MKKQFSIESLIVFLIRLAGYSLSYFIIYIISKNFGVEYVGFYGIIMKVFMTLGPLATFGLDVYVIKLSNKLFNNSFEQSKIYTQFRSGIFYKVLFLCSITLFILFLLNTYIKSEFIENYVYYLLIGIPIMSIYIFNVELIRSIGNLQVSELLRTILRPILLITLIFIFINKISSFKVLANFVVISIFISWLLSEFFLKSKSISKLPKINGNSISVHLKESIYMMKSSIFSKLINAMPLILIGIFLSEFDAGIYTVNLKIVLTTSIVLTVFNTVAGPKFSKLFSQNKIRDLKKLFFLIYKFIIAINLILTLIIIFYSKTILGFFGSQYVDSVLILYILLFGTLINSLTGPTGLLLNMSGNQKQLSLIFRNAFIILSIFSIPVIKLYGLVGISCLVSIIQAYVTLSAFFRAKKIIFNV